MELHKIQERFIDKAALFGTQFLLPPGEAFQYLDACVSSGFQLEGVEGFLITGNGAYQPSQEDSNDFSDVDCTREEFVERTKSFIKERSDVEVLFEVVFSDS